MGFEIEKKYLIKKPDINDKAFQDAIDPNVCNKITNTYLVSEDPEITRRVRSAENLITNETKYYYTEKQPIEGESVKHIENETEINKAAYDEFLKEKDPAKNPIEKMRFYIPMENGLTGELDIYLSRTSKPELSNRAATFEVEVPDVETLDNVKVPECFEVVKDVTDDPEYKNVNLATPKSWRTLLQEALAHKSDENVKFVPGPNFDDLEK